jgi:iron complex outermembrane recepter protein
LAGRFLAQSLGRNSADRDRGRPQGKEERQMNTHITKRIALAATAMGVVLTTPGAFAQEAADVTAGDIVVTARRMEERLQDVPISITVFTPEQISNQNIVNSTDLAIYTPSLAVNSRFGPEKASFAIRGFTQELNTQPTVAVYFADVVAPRLSSNITSGNGAGVGSMFDLQNVQVLKGPQGTLFGRNTTGGAILLVPRRPTDKFEGYIEGTYGKYDARRIEAVVNIPLADTFKVRLGVDRNQRDGYLRNRSGIGPADFNDVNYFAARLSILADLTPDLENYLVATYARSSTNGVVGRAAACNRGTTGIGGLLPTRAAICAQVDRAIALDYDFHDVENSNPNQFVKSRTWQIINTTTWRASDTLTVKNIASYGQAQERYSFNINGDNIPTPFVTTYPGPLRDQGHQWTFTEELQLQGRTGDDRLVWQAGGYMELSEPLGTQEQWTAVYSNCADVYAFRCTPLILPNGAPFTASSVGIARNNYFYRNFALYAQATYNITEQFSITGGIRNTWDWQKQTADNIRISTNANGPVAFVCTRAVTPTPNPGAALLTNGACGIGRTFIQKSSRPTWLINLDFKPNEDVLIFAKYARGYRAGGINEANSLVETWRPETIDNYELGIKASFDGAVRGNIAVTGFWNEFKDQQVTLTINQCIPFNPSTGAGRVTCSNPVLTGINGIQNLGKSRLRGVEVDGSILLGESVRFDLGYAYLDAKVTGRSAPTACDNTRYECAAAATPAVGGRLPFAPKHRITITGTYTLPLDESIGRISVGATFTHTDAQRTATFPNPNDLAFAAGTIPRNTAIAPATDLLNLNLNWRDIAGAPVDLTLFATNVTNEKYHVGFTNSLGSTGGDFIILGEPRMFGARLKYRFGS